MQMSSRPKPTTTRPITAPERKATCRPRLRPSLQPCAVRDEAAVAVRMPMKPHRPREETARQKGDRHERILNAVLGQDEENHQQHQRIRRSTTLYCRRR